MRDSLERIEPPRFARKYPSNQPIVPLLYHCALFMRGSAYHCETPR
jgi:hypothetical protein